MDTKGVVFKTALGWVAATERDGALVAVALPVASKQKAMAELGVETSFGPADGVLAEFAEDLRRYFAGTRVDFTRYRVDMSAQPCFRRRALAAARRIAYGEVRTYGWVARKAGNARAARAVGQAMARNPVPLVVPCHRVIATGGGLGGFGGGLDLKRALLELEGVRFSQSGTVR